MASRLKAAGLRLRRRFRTWQVGGLFIKFIWAGRRREFYVVVKLPTISFNWGLIRVSTEQKDAEREWDEIRAAFPYKTFPYKTRVGR